MIGFKFNGVLSYNGKISKEDIERILEKAIYGCTLVHDVTVAAIEVNLVKENEQK